MTTTYFPVNFIQVGSKTFKSYTPFMIIFYYAGQPAPQSYPGGQPYSYPPPAQGEWLSVKEKINEFKIVKKGASIM